MRKHVKEASALLMKWKKLYEGQPCSRTFYDVIVRGGPRTGIETIRESACPCAGVYEVRAEEDIWHNWEERRELVWLKRTYRAEYHRMRVFYRCPVCLQKTCSDWFTSENPEKWVFSGEKDKTDVYEVPF